MKGLVRHFTDFWATLPGPAWRGSWVTVSYSSFSRCHSTEAGCFHGKTGTSHGESPSQLSLSHGTVAPHHRQLASCSVHYRQSCSWEGKGRGYYHQWLFFFLCKWYQSELQKVPFFPMHGHIFPKLSGKTHVKISNCLAEIDLLNWWQLAIIFSL